jgi:DNA-binding transcriptional ArsR family regulator
MDDLQVIAEPRRRQILAMVWDEEMAASTIAAAFDITFGAVSQHLSVLREAGMVKVRREGSHRYYRADRDRLEPFRAILEAMWQETLRDLASTIERSERDPR